MNQTEKLLAEYRKKYQHKDLLMERDAPLNKVLIYVIFSMKEIIFPCNLKFQDQSEKLISPSSSTSDLSDDCENMSNEGWTRLDYMFYSCCLLFWVTLYAIFIQLQFGTVFFLLSCILGIYLNTRTRPKLQGEVSAYSVFNKNCESIDGTLKAEQFEREIRYGHSSVR